MARRVGTGYERLSEDFFRLLRVIPAATAARAKKGIVAAGMYQFQSMEEEIRYAVAAAALPAMMAWLRTLRFL